MGRIVRIKWNDTVELVNTVLGDVNIQQVLTVIMILMILLLLFQNVSFSVF